MVKHLLLVQSCKLIRSSRSMNYFKKFLNNPPIEQREGQFFHPRTWLWVGGAFLCVLLKEIVTGQVWDQWYYRGFFPVLRQAFDFLLGWSPLPMVYLVIGLILYRVILWSSRWRKGWVYQLSHALGGLAAMVTLFYVMWAFNYGQVSLQDRLGFDFSQIDQQIILQEFDRATNALVDAANALPSTFQTDEAITGAFISDHMLRDDVEAALSQLNMPCQGRVRVRQLWPKGLLLRLNTAGIYIPHTGEGHIDKGLLSVQKPFTIAHEMAHGYGVADEGACNFIAWLTCTISKDPWVRFGGALTYWRYAAAEMPSDSVDTVMLSLPPVVTSSMALIKINNNLYPDILPQVRDAIYSNYLKRHGIAGGLRSYNEVVLMVTQYMDRTSTGSGSE